MVHLKRAAVAIVLFACVLVLASCLPSTPSYPVPASGPPEPSVSVPATSATAAGLTESGGTVVARGWLTEYDIEGGTWVLENLPPTSSAGHAVVAVLVAGDVSLKGIAALRSAGPQGAAPFVEVTGRRASGASIRMAGPEVMVDTITVR
jgi:hypothetical protein